MSKRKTDDFNEGQWVVESNRVMDGFREEEQQRWPYCTSKTLLRGVERKQLPLHELQGNPCLQWVPGVVGAGR
jgi:hypothetical protein